MSIFKKKQFNDKSSPKADLPLMEKVKENNNKTGDDCPMCHIPQDIVDQLKKDDSQRKDERSTKNCCKK